MGGERLLAVGGDVVRAVPGGPLLHLRVPLPPLPRHAAVSRHTQRSDQVQRNISSIQFFLRCYQFIFSSPLSSMWVVSFQWRPPANFSGLVQFRATVVESYEVFWLGVASASLAVTAAGARLPGAALGGDRRTSYYNPRQGEGQGGQEEGVSYPDFVSLFEDYPGLENSSSDGKTAGSDKSNMSRAALAVTTHQVGGDSGYLEHDLNHDLASPLLFLVSVSVLIITICP